MSEQRNDGGPAFPVLCDFSGGEIRGSQTGNYSGWHEGLSLRDYFAIHADQPGRAEITDLMGWNVIGVNCKHGDTGAEHFEDLWNRLSLKDKAAASATIRYVLADALLAARAEKT